MTRAAMANLLAATIDDRAHGKGKDHWTITL